MAAQVGFDESAHEAKRAAETRWVRSASSGRRGRGTAEFPKEMATLEQVLTTSHSRRRCWRSPRGRPLRVPSLRAERKTGSSHLSHGALSARRLRLTPLPPIAHIGPTSARYPSGCGHARSRARMNNYVGGERSGSFCWVPVGTAAPRRQKIPSRRVSITANAASVPTVENAALATAATRASCATTATRASFSRVTSACVTAGPHPSPLVRLDTPE